jgi:hypothetical protein
MGSYSHLDTGRPASAEMVPEFQVDTTDFSKSLNPRFKLKLNYLLWSPANHLSKLYNLQLSIKLQFRCLRPKLFTEFTV